MKRSLICLLIFISFFTLNAQEVRNGNLFNIIEDIKNAMPGRDTYGYVEPTLSQQDTFGIIVDSILAYNYSYADSIAGMIDYKLLEWYDTANNNHLYYVLMENNADQSGGVQYGWGTYVFDFTTYGQVIIEVPHPIWDSNTWKVGFKSYQNIGADFFLMAGAHRYANGSNPAPADVAHNTQNMFHIVHQKVSLLSWHSLQVHGFNKNNPQYAGYPDVVLSNGSSVLTPILDSLSNAITSVGYTVGIFDGINWPWLGATTNTQGQWSRSNGCSFAHMELEYFIRSAQSEWENIINALDYVFLQPFLQIPIQSQPVPDQFTLQQNYPNPFNSSTNIEYSINQSQNVRLTIYNRIGQIINRLVDEYQNSGNYKINWNGRDINDQKVSSGLYFFQLELHGSKYSRKLILLE